MREETRGERRQGEMGISERTMGVAPTTVRAHIRNVYGELVVGSRTEALAKARELRLLA